MNDIYAREYCMIFTNEEISAYLINPLREYPNLIFRLLTSDGTEVSENSDEDISFVCFDGERENFYIRFDGGQTLLFISDEMPGPECKFTFSEEFMFIDDCEKEYIVSDETYGNVVYEGTLRDKTHKEILDLLCNIVILLIGAKKITVNETIVSQTRYHYVKYNYMINITNDTGIKKNIRYDNILFSVNE